MTNVIRHRPDQGESYIEERFREKWEKMSYNIILDQEFDVQTKVQRRRIDFAHQPTKTAIELDGYEYHAKDPEKYAKSLQRQRELVAIGWHVLAFSGSEINQDITKFVKEAHEIIADKISQQLQVQTPPLKGPTITVNQQAAIPPTYATTSSATKAITPSTQAPHIIPSKPVIKTTQNIPTRPPSQAIPPLQVQPANRPQTTPSYPSSYLSPVVPHYSSQSSTYATPPPSPYAQPVQQPVPYSYSPYAGSLYTWESPIMPMQQSSRPLLQKRKYGLWWALLFGVIAGVFEVLLARNSAFMGHVFGPILTLIILCTNPIVPGFIVSRLALYKRTGTIAGAIAGITYGVTLSFTLHQTIVANVAGTIIYMAVAALLAFIGARLATLGRSKAR